MLHKCHEAWCDGEGRPSGLTGKRLGCPNKVSDYSKSTLLAKARALGWSIRWSNMGRVTICPDCQSNSHTEGQS